MYVCVRVYVCTYLSMYVYMGLHCLYEHASMRLVALQHVKSMTCSTSYRDIVPLVVIASVTLTLLTGHLAIVINRARDTMIGTVYCWWNKKNQHQACQHFGKIVRSITQRFG